jgi:NAD(P)-dependent dehydrogenase (short-subunit alcohol dehydrogenase family)
MKVLVVGATGAVGRPLLPRLLSAGHEVIASARHRPPMLPPGVAFRELDLLQHGKVASVFRDVRPARIVHQATALAGLGNNLRAFDRSVALTNLGVVLRCAALDGPGTSLGRGGAQIEAIRERVFPLVGDGDATWSFLHVADDHPVRLGDWLLDVARLTGSPAPRRVPSGWLDSSVADGWFT